MKRRTFLTASSTIGIVGAVSGSTVVSSVYTSMSTSVLLEEFDPATKGVYDKFIVDVKENIQDSEMDEKLANKVFTPVQIISKKTTGRNPQIVYKNKAGEYVRLSVINGNQKVEISKTLN